LLIDTAGIYVRAVIDYRYLGRQAVLADVLSGSGALVGVREAYAERVVVLDALYRGTGGSQLEHIVVGRLSRYGYAGKGSYGSHKDLHAPVLQRVVRVDRDGGVVFIVFKLVVNSHAVDAAGRVDLVNRDLGSVHNRLAVNGRTAADGPDTADL